MESGSYDTLENYKINPELSDLPLKSKRKHKSSIFNDEDDENSED